MARRIPSPFEMMRAMIALPSVSSADPKLDQSNLPVIHLLAEWLEALGFDIEIQSVKDGKANLIAILGRSEAMDGLVLSGHTDTVPFDAGCWTVDPFGGVVTDERLYGLGSADMKSFLALAIEAASRFRADDLCHPLVILATADEESSMSGARLLAERERRLGRYCVIGEPTGMQPVRMHKGVMMEAIEIIGRAGHSSDPGLGANAIDGMHAVLSELIGLRADWREAHTNPLFKVPFPTLNLGSIHGGDNPNRICGQCSLQIDVRPLPGMAIGQLRSTLREHLAKALSAYPDLRWQLRPLFDGLPPFETPADAVLIETCEAITGQPAIAVAFGTEAPYFSQLGMETVVMGPGHIEQAHQPDEYLPLAHVAPCLKIAGRLIERFCVDKG